MPAIRLTQRRVDTLRPRKTVRNVRDAELKGYGVRVTPSGRNGISFTASTWAIGSGRSSAMRRS